MSEVETEDRMFEHEQFDVEIETDVDPRQLGWPGDDASDLGYTGNREYADMRGLTWADAEETFQEEQLLITRIEAAQSAEDEYSIILDELCEDFGCLHGLDIGVAATVVALSAAGCIPISSCNGGAFGDFHHESHPLVALYVRPESFSTLLQGALDAGAGFSNGDSGEAIIYATSIAIMMKFAKLLIDRHADFSSPAIHTSG